MKAKAAAPLFVVVIALLVAAPSAAQARSYRRTDRRDRYSGPRRLISGERSDSKRRKQQEQEKRKKLLEEQKRQMEERQRQREEAIKRKDIDLYLIALPNFLHKEVALQLADEKRNMVCTKPLARTKEEARAMLEAVLSLIHI